MKEWNHNTIYHKEILKNLPKSRISALDIGSGLGCFSGKLSSLFSNVISLEPDKDSISKAMSLYPENNITFINSAFDKHDFGCNKYDFITLIASIHHMDFKATLNKSLTLLNPEGKLVILGLYRERSPVDLLISLIAIIPNLIMNTITDTNPLTSMITQLPKMSIREIKREAKSILGSFKFKRHLFWRYSLVYKKS